MSVFSFFQHLLTLSVGLRRLLLVLSKAGGSEVKTAARGSPLSPTSKFPAYGVLVKGELVCFRLLVLDKLQLVANLNIIITLFVVLNVVTYF